MAHARGSLARPLTDEEPAAKARGLVDRIRPGGANALDAATRGSGPGYLRRLLAAAEPTEPTQPAAQTAQTAQTHRTSRRERGVGPRRTPRGRRRSAVDHRHVAAAGALLDEAAGLRERLPAGDERDRAGAVAAALVEAGHRPAVAAAVAPCAAAHLPRADAARAVALGLAVAARLATRLDVAVDRLPAFAAGLAVTAAHRLPPDAALYALGLLGTQTTAVTGTTASRPVDARRARLAAADAVESTALARRGFTGPARPLTGRRGLLSLLGHRADPSLAGPEPPPGPAGLGGAPIDDAALDDVLPAAPASQR